MMTKEFSAGSAELCACAMAIMRCMSVKDKVSELYGHCGHLCNKDGLTMLKTFAEF